MAFPIVTITMPRSARVFLPLLFMSAIAIPASPGSAAEAPVAIQGTAQDVLTVRRNLRAALLSGTPDAAAGRWLNEMRADGSWADQVYTDTDRENWKAGGHLPRLLSIARAYYMTGTPLSGRPEVKAQILAGLGYWLQADPHNTNWWHNEIGVPKQIGELLILLDTDATPDLMEKGIALMLRSKWQKWTGQNLVWGTQIQIMRGCLMDSPELVSEAYARMWSEVRYAESGKEGIQADNSFHQHGALLYAGGYGSGFTADVTRFQVYAQGTVFELPAAKRAILESYVLDGQQWMVRGSMWDFGAVGRELVRQGKSAEPLLAPVSQLAAMNGPRRAEFAAFAARMRGEGGTPLNGNRYYWKSDYMAQHRPGYMFSTRMCSTRTLNTDGYINGENKKSQHLADGATFIARSGREYFDIAPVWDWLRIPGTTIEQNTPFVPNKLQRRGTTSFVGGVSDGHYGCAAMDLASGALTARKAWFYFEDQIVCLGAGINCPTDNPVFTSINQCLLNGPVRDSNSAAPIATGNRLEKGVKYVWHDGVGYLFPSPTDVQLRNEAQTGSWREVGPRSADPVQRDVFSLWLDHGPQAKDASYAYIVAPGQDAAGTAVLSAQNPIQILSNTPDLQAVWYRDITLDLLEAAFRRPGTLTAGDLAVSVDQPCLLLLQQQHGEWRVTVSNPLATEVTVVVTVNRKLVGRSQAVTVAGENSTIRFLLAGGQRGGMSLIWDGVSGPPVRR